MTGTNPEYFDTDGDLLGDGWERANGLNPKEAEGTQGAQGDRDGDGLDNFDEQMHGTNATMGGAGAGAGAAPGSDSDGDGVDDGEEVAQGSDPNDSADGGEAPAEGEIEDVDFWVGDPSESHSERWQLTIKGTDPAKDKRIVKFQSREFGQVDQRYFKLRKGAKYELTLQHIATEPNWKADNGPDFDWQAQIGGKPFTPVLKPGQTGVWFMVGNSWIADNRSGLLGSVDENFSSSDHSAGKVATLLPYEFTELNPESGFDKYTEPHWLMVPKDQQNWTKAITPASAGMEIKFKVIPAPGGATVSPDHTNQSPETLTVSSPTLGDTTAVAIGIGTSFGTEGLKLSVKKYKSMTVTLHAVTQQDGGGAPDALCIGPGANGVTDTIPGGDDTVGGGGIRTGGNGLCETTKQGDDVQILRPAIKVTQVPSASEVQQMLTTVYGLQVNTYFTVTLDQKVVDYDLDRDSILDVNVAAAPSDEQNVLEGHVKSGTDFNLYYIHDYVTHGVAKPSAGFTIQDLKCAYINDWGSAGVYRVHTAAHEIGHIFGLAHPDINRIIHTGLEPAHGNDKDRLMNGEYNPQNLKPSLLLKFEWDVINPKP